MHLRLSTGELCYPYLEFRELSVAEVCRQYGWGDSWVDQIRDQQAEKELTDAEAS